MRSPESPLEPSPVETSPVAPSSLPRGLRWAELTAIVVAALLSLAFHLTLPARLPGEADHQAAGAHLQQHAREGDVVLLAPWWTERARLYAPAALPVVGYLGSDRDDLLDYRRIWVLSQPRLPHAELGAFEAAFLGGRTQVGESESFGPLRLALYENGRFRPARWRLSDALSSATVHLEEPNGSRRPCPSDGRSFRCPGGAHLYVATEWHEVLYEPRRCVYLHAPGGETRMVVELPEVPGGADYTLEAGIIWEHAHKKDGARTVTEVEAKGAGLNLSVPLPPGLEGFQRASGRSGGGPLRIAVSSPEPDSRQVCVVLTAREARP